MEEATYVEFTPTGPVAQNVDDSKANKIVFGPKGPRVEGAESSQGQANQVMFTSHGPVTVPLGTSQADAERMAAAGEATGEVVQTTKPKRKRKRGNKVPNDAEESSQSGTSEATPAA